jgi:DNA-binding MarR family transcriptional regulator
MKLTRPRYRYKRRLREGERALWRAFVIAHTRVIRTLEEELRALHGLDLASFEVLYELVTAPDNQRRMAELAERLVYTRGGITRVGDRLASHGYLERRSVDGDARGVCAILTDKGFAVFDASVGDHVDGVRRLFLDPVGDDAATLAQVLSRLTSATSRTLLAGRRSFGSSSNGVRVSGHRWREERLEAALAGAVSAVEVLDRLAAFVAEIASPFALRRQRENALLYVRGLVEHGGP